MYYRMQKETRLKLGKMHSPGTKQASVVFTENRESATQRKKVIWCCGDPQKCSDFPLQEAAA